MLTPWLIVIITVLVVYFLDRWENKYIKSLFDWVPAILLAYLIPAGISYVLKKDFSSDGIHEYSKLYFIPLAIIAVMSSLSIGQLKNIGWKPILIFFIGSCWIALFPIFTALVLQESFLVDTLLLDQNYWKGLPPIVGSWIGGSTSQLVLKELVECPEHIFLTVLVLDNILVNIWTIIMFQTIKKSNLLNTWLGITNQSMPKHIITSEGKSISGFIVIIILLSVVVLTNVWFVNFVVKIIILSVLGLLFSNLIKGWNHVFALKIGSILILIVMAILGLKLKFDLLEFNGYFLSFLIIWLVSHFIIMLIAAKILNINTAWVPIASMANVGGIATAPAVTAAYEKKWMPHAIILAILSMATGTFWGMITIYAFKFLILKN